MKDGPACANRAILKAGGRLSQRGEMQRSEGEVADEFPAEGVADDFKVTVGEDLGEPLAKVGDHGLLPSGLLLWGDGVEGGGAEVETVAGAVFGTDAGGEFGGDGEETGVLGIGGGAVGGGRAG